MGGQRNPGGPGAGRDRGGDNRKDNDKKDTKHASMGDLNDKFKGHEQKVKDSGGGGKESNIVEKAVDAVGDFVSDTYKDVRGWFKGEEDTGGFSPMGGPMSYGLSKKAFDETIGQKRHAARSLDQRLLREVDYFREAPMDYAADLIRNPLVAGAAAFTGTGLTAFGITAVDTIMDYVQNEATPQTAIRDLAADALDLTPVGSVLGPMQGIARAAIDSPEAAALATGTLMGTTVGAPISRTLATALTSNPLASAAITAAGTVGAGVAGKKAMEVAMETPGVVGMETPEVSQKERRESPLSPLTSTGKAAVEASKKLTRQPIQTDLYARTVKQLPYYGLNIQQQTQLPYYGV